MNRLSEQQNGPPDAHFEAEARAIDSTLDPHWAWARYVPDEKRPWTRQLAGHLYRRAAFGATWEQLEAALSAGPQKAVDRLLAPNKDVAAFNQSMDDFEGPTARSGEVAPLRAWWLRRIIETPHPLLEKMTLFWHGHFGVSNVRVNSPQIMRQHVSTLRQYALSDYSAMLTSVSADPAMFLALDAASNRRVLPNEQLARQMLESLSVGPENYGEEDVRETARAFTGWFVLRGSLRYFPREHDEGEKTILGEKGNWAAKDIVRIVLRQPETAQALARKLFRLFISEVDSPSDELLEPLAAAFARDYDVSRALETILRSNLFFSPYAYRQRIKSPVEFAIGLVRALEGTIPTQPLGNVLGELGQSLYEPPTPRGWPGGRHWINAATLVGRDTLAHSLVAAKGAYKGKLNPLDVLHQHDRNTGESAATLLLGLLVQDDVPEASRKAILGSLQGDTLTAQRARELVTRIACLPEFQLC